VPLRERTIFPVRSSAHYEESSSIFRRVPLAERTVLMMRSSASYEESSSIFRRVLLAERTVLMMRSSASYEESSSIFRRVLLAERTDTPASPRGGASVLGFFPCAAAHATKKALPSSVGHRLNRCAAAHQEMTFQN
jgi:hypothetical protein